MFNDTGDLFPDFVLSIDTVRTATCENFLKLKMKLFAQVSPFMKRTITCTKVHFHRCRFIKFTKQ